MSNICQWKNQLTIGKQQQHLFCFDFFFTIGILVASLTYTCYSGNKTEISWHFLLILTCCVNSNNILKDYVFIQHLTSGIAE